MRHKTPEIHLYAGQYSRWLAELGGALEMRDEGQASDAFM